MKAIASAAIALALAGCAATTTAVSKRNLDVQTRMSDSIFLSPVTPGQRTVYVAVRNTSDRPDLDLEAAVRQSVAARGYLVVDDPAAAHFILQANILQAGRSSETATEAAYKGGFGGTLVGGAAGGAVGYGIGKAGGGNDVLLTVGGAIIGAAIEGITGAFVQDVTYSVVTDIQVSEPADVGQVVTESESADLTQGTSGRRAQSSSRTIERRTYATRIVSKANKANLEWAEAAPALVDGVTRSVAGIF
jgi:outer membrane lipoprotein SlyB